MMAGEAFIWSSRTNLLGAGPAPYVEALWAS